LCVGPVAPVEAQTEELRGRVDVASIGEVDAMPTA
jgi:hypothetical protein